MESPFWLKTFELILSLKGIQICGKSGQAYTQTSPISPDSHCCPSLPLLPKPWAHNQGFPTAGLHLILFIPTTLWATTG